MAVQAFKARENHAAKVLSVWHHTCRSGLLSPLSLADACLIERTKPMDHDHAGDAAPHAPAGFSPESVVLFVPPLSQGFITACPRQRHA